MYGSSRHVVFGEITLNVIYKTQIAVRWPRDIIVYDSENLNFQIIELVFWGPCRIKV